MDPRSQLQKKMVERRAGSEKKRSCISHFAQHTADTGLLEESSKFTREKKVRSESQKSKYEKVRKPDLLRSCVHWNYNKTFVEIQLQQNKVLGIYHRRF